MLLPLTVLQSESFRPRPDYSRNSFLNAIEIRHIQDLSLVLTDDIQVSGIMSEVHNILPYFEAVVSSLL